MKFSTRAKQLTGSATMAATLLAQQRKKSGEDIVLATVGEPDGDIPDVARAEIIKQIQSGVSKYGPAQGLLPVREAVAKWMSALYAQVWTSDQVIISPGSKFALFSIFQMLSESGDEVLIPTPYWVSYESLADLAGANPVIVSCSAGDNYKLSAEALSRCLIENPRIKLLILNSPNNPTGAIYSREELTKLSAVIERHPNLLVVCDDIYNQLIFSQAIRCPHLLDVISDEAKKRIIVVHGASKSFALTGWRLGWIVAEPELVSKLSQFQSQTLTCIPDFIQMALIPTLNSGEEFVTSLKEKISQRYKLAAELLKKCPAIKIYPSEGAFYIWMEVLNPKMTSAQLATDILEKVGLALVPGSAFGYENHLRFSVTLPDDQLLDGAGRLVKYFAPSK